MLDFLRTEFLQPAEEAILRGDYGTALYHAYVVNTAATRFLRDEEAARTSGDLVSLILGLINADFEAIAEQRELTVTPENKAALLQEHSPHYVRFRELLTQPIPEISLKNTLNFKINSYWKTNEKLYNSFYKIIKNFNEKNLRKRHHQ